MTKVQQISSILLKNKISLHKKYYVKQIGIFGSYIRGEQKKNSDLDILIDFSKPIGLLKFVELENYLSRLCKAKIDLVMKSALKPMIGRKILQEVVYL